MANCWWCVNFDDRPVLLHGLKNNMWLMQYQYSHAGYHFQGHRAQLSATSTNWNILTRVAVGDWFAAYLRNSTFYAIGEVVEPRAREHQLGAAMHVDTVERTTTEHRHVFLDGVIRYRDAPVLYEDFTDTWRYAITPASENQPSEWRYPQRVDVRQWQLILELLREGNRMYGLQLVAASRRRLKRGTVYVTLARMEEKGYITSHLEDPPSQAGGLPRRLYRPTALGLRVLTAWTSGAPVLMPEFAR